LTKGNSGIIEEEEGKKRRVYAHDKEVTNLQMRSMWEHGGSVA
jgi:hypothetical protein